MGFINKDSNKNGRNLGGAPKKNVTADKLMGFWVTKDEKDKIIEDFLKSNYTKVSHYLKNIVLNKECEIIYIDQTKEVFLKELHKIGTNINQIAKHFNAQKQFNFTKYDESILESFKNVYQELGKLIDK